MKGGTVQTWSQIFGTNPKGLGTDSILLQRSLELWVFFHGKPRFCQVEDATAYTWRLLSLNMYNTEVPTDNLRCVPLCNYRRISKLHHSSKFIMTGASLSSADFQGCLVPGHVVWVKTHFWISKTGMDAFVGRLVNSAILRFWACVGAFKRDFFAQAR